MRHLLQIFPRQQYVTKTCEKSSRQCGTTKTKRVSKKETTKNNSCCNSCNGRHLKKATVIVFGLVFRLDFRLLALGLFLQIFNSFNVKRFANFEHFHSVTFTKCLESPKVVFILSKNFNTNKYIKIFLKLKTRIQNIFMKWNNNSPLWLLICLLYAVFQWLYIRYIKAFTVFFCMYQVHRYVPDYFEYLGFR